MYSWETITDRLHDFKQMTNVYEVTSDYDVIIIGKFTNTDKMTDQIKALLADPDINESNRSVVLNALIETEQFELTVEDD